MIDGGWDNIFDYKICILYILSISYFLTLAFIRMEFIVVEAEGALAGITELIQNSDGSHTLVTYA